MHSVRALFLLATTAILFPYATLAQGTAKALTCFFQEGFESGLPAAWDIGPTVERQNADGDSLGEFVPAWTVGDAGLANANGNFAVADQPIGNRFAMANDDALPCNCTMADVNLTTPTLDLTARTNVGLQARVFNNGFGGGDTAYVLASTNGADWDTVLSVPPAATWHPIVADLSAYDGQSALLIRFNWSDGGGWAGGSAVDDVCIGERFANDLSVISIHTNDVTASPFTSGDQGLRYRQVPVEQMAALRPSLKLRNTGSATAVGATASVRITLNGNEVYNATGIALGDLAPGTDSTYVFTTDWVAAEVGDVVVSVQVSSAAVDEDATDNTATTALEVTGSGWENDYRAMAGDEGNAQVSIGGDEAYIAATRMEVVNEGSVIRGISAAITGFSTLGAQVRAILLDGNLAFVDTSLRHTLTQEDLDRAAGGGLLYLPLSTPTTTVPGDYFAGMQRLEGDGEVHIWCSGERPAGSDVQMQGTGFEVTYLPRTPMVRLHFEDLGVGIPEPTATGAMALRAFPVPMVDSGWVTFQATTSGTAAMRISDATGRLVKDQDLGTVPAGNNRLALDISDLAAGSYLLTLTVNGSGSTVHFAVER